MAVLTLPPTVIPVGTTSFGPANAPFGWRKAVLVLDLANLVGALTVLLEYTSDGGLSWNQSGRYVVEPPASWQDKQGNVLTTRTMVITPPVNADTLGHPNPRYRGSLTATVAFLLSGSLTVT